METPYGVFLLSKMCLSTVFWIEILMNKSLTACRFPRTVCLPWTKIVARADIVDRVRQ